MCVCVCACMCVCVYRWVGVCVYGVCACFIANNIANCTTQWRPQKSVCIHSLNNKRHPWHTCETKNDLLISSQRKTKRNKRLQHLFSASSTSCQCILFPDPIVSSPLFQWQDAYSQVYVSNLFKTNVQHSVLPHFSS